MIKLLNYINYIHDSIMRRMNTDDEQFKEFEDFDIRIKNEDF